VAAQTQSSNRRADAPRPGYAGRAVCTQVGDVGGDQFAEMIRVLLGTLDRRGRSSKPAQTSL
jgi:hypothetical protein